jgi:tight adherence protein B
MRIQVASAVLLGLVFAFVQDVFQVWILSVSVCVALLALAIETLSIKARARARQVSDEWPSVLESFESAAQSGMSLLDSIRDLAESTQLLVSKDFAFAVQLCDLGLGLDAALTQLKQRFGLSICDSTIETLRLVNDSGGAGYLSALRHQSRAIRASSSVSLQIQAKQGWVLGTAKIAVAAPWLIVVLLSGRPENVAAYSSLQGSMLLLAGLAASVVAVYLITQIGKTEEQIRVLA